MTCTIQNMYLMKSISIIISKIVHTDIHKESYSSLPLWSCIFCGMWCLWQNGSYLHQWIYEWVSFLLSYRWLVIALFPSLFLSDTPCFPPSCVIFSLHLSLMRFCRNWFTAIFCQSHLLDCQFIVNSKKVSSIYNLVSCPFLFRSILK